jgi:hypothetical protein
MSTLKGEIWIFDAYRFIHAMMNLPQIEKLGGCEGWASAQKVHIFLVQENLGTGQTLDFFGRTNMVPVPMGKNDELDFVWLDGSTLEPTFEFP